ncbi:uncharacterized protein LOC122499081 [Leptopilina heterotoma]|uniref:uncharacterized protein LOC122499081 n=1 Tax=Leptopilina heterotoma TaxID=63436 RepID=UPI001CA9FEB0|nr:uncharacterized protein LOC122499081 [Leptopilina heterotoma]
MNDYQGNPEPNDDNVMCEEYLHDDLEYEDIVQYDTKTQNFQNFLTELRQSQRLMSQLRESDLKSIAGMMSRSVVNSEPRAFSSSSKNEIHITPSVKSNRTIALKHSIDLIPEFDGENISIEKFLQECRDASDNTDPENHYLLLKYILRKIKGKAADFISHAQIQSLDQLFKELQEAYSFSYDFSTIFLQVASLTQQPKETIHSYAAKARKFLFQLNEYSRKELPSNESASKTLEYNQHVTKAFCRGLLPELEHRVNTKCPSNLKQAIGFALQAENLVSLLTNRKLEEADSSTTNEEPPSKKQKTVSNIEKDEQKQSSNNHGCYVCGKKGHISRNCWHRAGSTHSNKDDKCNNFLNKKEQSNDKNNVKNNNNKSSKEECEYCERKGHSTDKCYLKRIEELEKL